jgi:hypothetical protein
VFKNKALPPSFRFSPILIIALVGLLLTALLSISDTVGYLFAGAFGAWLTLAFFATDMVEKRIEVNVERATKDGKVGKRKIGILNWPKASLKQGTRLWGYASLLFGVEIGLEVASPYIGLLSTIFSYFYWGGVGLSLVAGFQTYRIIEFIMNPSYRPQVTMYFIGNMLFVLAIDFAGLYFFLQLYPIFSILLLWAKIFAILLVLSIFSSIPLLWQLRKRSERRKTTLIMMAFGAPYALLGIIIVIVVLSVLLHIPFPVP